jgi:hypothetical protein
MVLGDVIDEYVNYGMGVFEYEHERQQVLVQQKEDVTLEMQEGVSVLSIPVDCTVSSE